MQRVSSIYKHRNALAGLAILTLCLTVIANVAIPSQAAATLTLSPSSTSTIVGTPTSFSVVGGNATTTYDIYLDGVTTSTTFVSASDGTGSFTYTFNTVGQHVLSLRMQTSHTSVGQSSVNVIDIVALIMPWIIIMIVLMVVFAVPEMFDRVFKNAF